MKPMLASPAGPLIPYPMLLSPKLDGIRCLIINGRRLWPQPQADPQQARAEAVRQT